MSPRRPSLLIAASISLGGALYLGGRPTTLRMFAWADTLGLGPAVHGLRELLAPVVSAAPDWAVFSLPFGLWLFALVLAVRDTRWIPAALALGIGSELAQLPGLMPGTFDPVDLFVLAACGAAGLLWRDTPKPGLLRPVAATTAFVVMGAGTTSEPTEEEKAAFAAKHQEERKTLAAYSTSLRTIHDRIAALDLDALQPKPCKQVPVERPKDSMGLRTVELSYLARFGADKAAWTPVEGDWAFLTDSNLSGHFRKHPDDRGDMELGSIVERVEKAYLPEKYLIVVAPVRGGKVAPVMHDDRFDSGELTAWMFLVDQESGELACQERFTTISSESIDFGGLLDGDDPTKEMMEDFQDNVQYSIERRLPKGVRISNNYGSMLR